MPRVKMPDGAVVDMPDELTPELATRLKSLQSGAPAAPAPVAPDHSTRDTIGGMTQPFYKSIASTLGAPGDIGQQLGAETRQTMQQGMPGKPLPEAPKPPGLPTSSDIRGWMTKAGMMRPEYEPTSSVGKFASGATELLAPMAAGIAPSVPGMARALPGAARSAMSGLTGAKVPGAVAEASGAARAGVASRAGAEAQTAGAEQSRVKALTDVQTALTNKLEAAKAPNSKNTLDVQGDTLRESFTGAMDAAKTERTKQADKLYGAAKKEASRLEATGARADITDAIKPLDDLIGLSENIPTLQSKAFALRNAVKGAPPTTPGTATTGLTYEQLDVANRFIKDVAYGADVEGYGSIIRNAAREVSHRVDTALNKFVPEHAQAVVGYRKLSEPLESLGTRFGRAVSGTEGGLGKDAYAKVAAQDLPGKMFAKRDGVELMVDALAGGKTGPARAAAQKQVDTMVENWIVESMRTKAPSAKVSGLAAPGMQGTLSAVPNVASKLGSQFGAEAGMERTVKRLGDVAGERASVGQSATKLAESLKEELRSADVSASMPGKKAQTDAYNSYVRVLKNAKVAGRLPPEQYRAALELIDRADTLAEKAKRAQDLAKKIAGLMGISGAAALGISVTGVVK